MAVADETLFGYSSLNEVRQQEIPAGQDELVLRFNDSVLERPILRKCTRAGGITDDPIPKDAFLTIFKSTLINAAYLWGPSPHAIRRQLGKGADRKFACPMQEYPFILAALLTAMQGRNTRGRALTTLDTG